MMAADAVGPQMSGDNGFSSVILVLHAHLPFVRHPEHERCLEETWFFEALVGCYLRLVPILRKLDEDGIGGRIVLSLSPTLIAMLKDRLLNARFERHLDDLQRLVDAGIRTEAFPLARALAWQRACIVNSREEWNNWRKDPIEPFRMLAASGRIELVTTAATHGLLPLLHQSPGCVETQIRLGLRVFENTFGQRPTGFWLPECCWSTAVGEQLLREGIHWTIVEENCFAHQYAFPAATTPEGLGLFRRDREVAGLVWSRRHGFPAHPDYREFHRDALSILPADLPEIQPFLTPDNTRLPAGLKVWSIGNPPGTGGFYNPDLADMRAQLHAAEFVDRISKRASDGESLLVCPFDAELFGHWWFEGPEWLDATLRLLHKCRNIDVRTPSQLPTPPPLADQPTLSSWGEGGDIRHWLGRDTEWIFIQLHHAALRLPKLRKASSHSRNSQRAFSVACRCLLQAQASDWPFMIAANTTADYAKRRFNELMRLFHWIGDQLSTGELEDNVIEELEDLESCFSELDDNSFAWAFGVP